MKHITISVIVCATVLAIAWLALGRYRYDTSLVYQTRTDRLTGQTEVIFYSAGDNRAGGRRGAAVIGAQRGAERDAGRRSAAPASYSLLLYSRDEDGPIADPCSAARVCNDHRGL